MVIKIVKTSLINPPYQRDNRLIVVPLFETTHLMTYPCPNLGKYLKTKSRYKKCVPFIKKVENQSELNLG